MYGPHWTGHSRVEMILSTGGLSSVAAHKLQRYLKLVAHPPIRVTQARGCQGEEPKTVAEAVQMTLT